MFKIGEFSRLNGVTVKTLHHYDRLGLLKPAYVDKYTNYRFYTIVQIEDLNRILAFKDLGLSLDEIQHLVDVGLSADEMRGVLKLKQSELQQSIIEAQARLARVEARLNNLSKGKTPTQEIVIREVEAQSVLSLRQNVALQSDLPDLFRRVLHHASEAKLIGKGAWIALHHHQDYREADLDVEICIPTQQNDNFTLDIDGVQAKMRELESVTVATTLCYFRVPNDIYEANLRVYQWIVNNGYQIAPYAGREVYSAEVEANQAIPLEVQLPILS